MILTHLPAAEVQLRIPVADGEEVGRPVVDAAPQQVGAEPVLQHGQVVLTWGKQSRTRVSSMVNDNDKTSNYKYNL